MWYGIAVLVGIVIGGVLVYLYQKKEAAKVAADLAALKQSAVKEINKL